MVKVEKEIKIEEQKPRLTIDTLKNQEIKNLNVDDEVKISAVGKVVRVSSDKDFEREKRMNSATFELTDIKFDNITEEDKKEAEEEGVKTEDWIKIKNLKKKVKESIG